MSARRKGSAGSAGSAGSIPNIGKKKKFNFGSSVSASFGALTLQRTAFQRHFGISMKKAEVLGRGQYGEVFKVQDSKLGTVAVKVVKKSGLKNQEEKIFIKTEMKIHSQMDHPNIAKLHETFSDRKHHYFVLELIKGGELFDRIFHESGKTKYTEKTAALVARNIAEALAYMHEKNIVHRDMKPENLMLSSVDDLTNVKIVDFGVAAKCDEPLRSPFGTLMYIAPEILNEVPYKTEVDMWSFGVIVYCMLCGNLPFFHPDEVTLAWQIMNQNINFDAKEWNLISYEAKDLIARLLERDTSKRLTAKQALEHEWIKNAEDVKETAIEEAGTKYNQFKAKSVMLQALNGLRALDRMKNLMEKLGENKKNKDGEGEETPAEKPTEAVKAEKEV